MSMTFNMVGGGGSGIPGNRAVLVARIPSGSTVTATKGGVTLTPMMWVSETYPDQDIALFVFTPAQFDSVNPWTITATDGTSTASTTIFITDNKEYEVELTYEIVFVENGVLTSLPWTIATNPDYPSAAVVQETGQVMFTTGSEYAATVFGSTDAYDLTDYTTLRLVVASGQSYYRSDKAPCVAIGRNRPTGTGTSASATNLDYLTMLNGSTGAISATTYTLDVSALSGLFYVGISLAGSASLSDDDAGKIRVTDFGIFK